MAAVVSADSALLVIGRTLWNPKPTTDDKSEHYLAHALGYPRSWRVERRIIIEEEEEVADDNEDEDPKEEEEGQDYNKNKKKLKKKKIIVDRIFTGPKDKGMDMYFNHHAAQIAAMEWIEGESTGYENKGGQLLPRKPKFQKGDQVKVNYEGDWCTATIQKRTERKDGYRYVVYYPEDDTTQTAVLESMIEHADDPYQVAENLGLVGGWQAKLISGKKWKYISPDGKNFTSKASAFKHQKKMEKEKEKKSAGGDGGSGGKKRGRKAKSKSGINYKDEPDIAAGTDKDKNGNPLLSDGDPPWRTTGHDLIGKRVVITMQHQKSATRTVSISQEGTIMGWISETDVDTNGEAGFISEKTNKPANLFHCVFDDEPSHPYFTLLVERKDLEEYEVLESLIPGQDDDPQENATAVAEGEPPKKKKATGKK